ncbi:SPOR domain-containing protein [Bartonella sp. CB178]|uniref:SPOR domain-containing protein n=1 Tax=Bartonella sp. CB178 TaxID=3112255 RepID=UPI00300E091E
MGDDNRKNLQETERKSELYDPVEGLAQNFNSEKRSGDRSALPPLRSGQSTPQTPEVSFRDKDFDLSFLEEELENDLSDDVSFGGKNQRWEPQVYPSEPSSSANAKMADVRFTEQSVSPSRELHSGNTDQDEEQILDALSPLPIQKNQQARSGTTSLLGEGSFGTQPEVFFGGLSSRDNNVHTAPSERTPASSQVSARHPETGSLRQSYDSDQTSHSASVNYPRRVDADNYPKFDEEKSLGRDPRIAGNSESEYSGPRTQRIGNAELSHDEGSGREFFYDQSNLDGLRSSKGVFGAAQTAFHVEGRTHRDNLSPCVDTYKFAEEMVEKTGPIMVPEVPYTAPEYDVPVDNLQEEFADVFNVGNASEKKFSRQQEDKGLNDIFHQAAQNPVADVHVGAEEKNATGYFSADEMGYYPPSFAGNSSHEDKSESVVGTSAVLSPRTFMEKKIVVRSTVFLALIVISFIGYSRFFVSSRQSEGSLIIHADDAPFKLKPETTEVENAFPHNLDVYKQATEQNEQQETAQRFLIDDSEAPEDLTSLNQQDSEDILPPFFDEDGIEDAIQEATDRTVPTREVQAVVIEKDGEIVSSPVYDQGTESVDDHEVIEDSTVDQYKDAFSTSPKFSEEDQSEAGRSLSASTDEMDTDVSAVPDIASVPIPSRAKFDPDVQGHSASHLNSTTQVAAQSSENYYVQVASQPTSALAQDSLQNIKYKFGYLIGSRPLNIQPAFISGKGTYYRVRILTQNRNEAINLCEDIKSSGGNCFITR